MLSQKSFSLDVSVGLQTSRPRTSADTGGHCPGANEETNVTSAGPGFGIAEFGELDVGSLFPASWTSTYHQHI